MVWPQTRGCSCIGVDRVAVLGTWRHVLNRGQVSKTKTWPYVTACNQSKPSNPGFAEENIWIRSYYHTTQGGVILSPKTYNYLTKTVLVSTEIVVYSTRAQYDTVLLVVDCCALSQYCGGSIPGMWCHYVEIRAPYWPKTQVSSYIHARYLVIITFHSFCISSPVNRQPETKNTFLVF